MSLEQFGVPYIFGFNELTPPSIGGGLVLTELTLDKKPEFFVTGTNGAGQVAAVTKPTPDQDMNEFNAKGYIQDLADFDAVADTFTWNGRFYFIDSKTEPFKEKEYLMVDIKGRSYKLVTG